MPIIPDISIILPVYNCQEYLKKCLDSLINQTYKNIEIIAINDGSTDNSGNILNYYANKDNRIKLIDKQNSGVSSTRNIGLDNAIGKYVMFIDADDWYNNDTCEKLFNTMENNQCDICRFGYINIMDDHIRIAQYPLEQGFYNKNAIISQYLEPMIGPNNISGFNKPSLFSGNTCFHIIKHSIIEENHIRFSTELFHSEDTLFTINVLLHCNSLYCLNEPFYNYLQRQGSCMNSYNKDFANQYIKYIHLLKNLLKNYNLDEKYKIRLEYKTCMNAYRAAEYICSVCHNMSIKQINNIINNALSKPDFENALKNMPLDGLSFKYKMPYKFLKNKSYKNFYSFYKLRNFYKSLLKK